MSNPVILITGALTGIGRATALAFAKIGARLVVNGRRPAEGKALQLELQRLGAEAVFIGADVRHDDEVAGLIDQAVARFGHLDVAVNIAGTEGQPGLIVNQTAQSYAATFDTNVLGTLLSLKHELRVMTAQKRGSIINISSTSKSAALEVASTGVRVNAVAPGPTDTGMLDRFTGTPENKTALIGSVPLGRIGKPDDIANAVLFLAADASSFVTGQIFTVDGGKTAG